MNITNGDIDGGKPFDWGKTSTDYAKYRDIYPKVFYDKIAERNLCIKGQKVLDLGTGTGVLPRNMFHFGAEWTGTDISENQIAQAKRMSEELNLKIEYQVVATEEFLEETFDVITACQCFWYETRHPIYVPECVYKEFETVYHEEYDVDVPFTRESWHGRMKACQGIGASLSPQEIKYGRRNIKGY